MDEQKEHALELELAATQRLLRALKQEALREKDRNRKQCERERDIGVAPTISAPTISVRIKNVVGVTLNNNSWRVQTDGIQKTMKKKEDAERHAYEHFESNPDKGRFEVQVDGRTVFGETAWAFLSRFRSWGVLI